MSIELTRTPNKFAAISFIGTAVVFLLIWFVFFWASSINVHGGMNTVQSFLIRLSVAVPVVIIMAAYVTLARQLWRGGLD